MSSSAVAKPKRGIVSSLQGQRPLPLSVPAMSPPWPAKRHRVVVVNDDDDDDVLIRAPPAALGPVILYEHTPKVIHARPDEFKALVQRLTGRQQTAGGGDQDQESVLRPAAQMVVPSSSSSQQEQDPLLVLTLGQQQVPLPPSPGGGGAGDFLLSPGSFLFSPATMQAIHELIS